LSSHQPPARSLTMIGPEHGDQRGRGF